MQLTEKELAQHIIEISGVKAKNCIQCGKCSATCPVGEHMEILPHRVVWELNQGHVKNLQAANTVWKCLSCFACSARCPRGLDPAALIEAVRLSIVRAQGANKIKPDDIPAMVSEHTPQQAVVSILRKYAK